MTAAGTDSSAAAGSAPPKPAWTSFIRRLLISVGLLLVIALPSLLVARLWNPGGFGVVMLGALAAFTVMVVGNWRAAFSAGVALLLLVPLALVASQVPITGACLMAVACLASGLTSVWGLNRAFRIVPIYLAFFIVSPFPLAPGPIPVTSPAYIYTMMAMLAIGLGWILILGRLVGDRLPRAPAARSSLHDALRYTALTTVLCSVSTFVVLSLQTGHAGAWLVLTLLLVLQVAPQDTLSQSRARVFGTLIGAGVAAVIGLLVTSEAGLAAAALVCLVGAVMTLTGPRYWLFVAFLTPAVILLSAEPGEILTVDVERVAYTLVGGALAIVASLLLALGESREAADLEQSAA